MPWSCFSYEADTPSSIGHRDVAEPAPPGPRRMTTTHCLGYLADLNRMPYSEGWTIMQARLEGIPASSPAYA